MAENTRPETQGKKKFKLTDAILSVICVVFVAEAAAPVAAIGNSQYFWWIFLMLTFLLPTGLLPRNWEPPMTGKADCMTG